MLTQFLFALLTAVLASALTLGAAYYLFQRRWRPRLEDELRAREAELDKKLEDYGEEIRERVRQGIVDGVAAIPSSETIREGTRSLAKTGADIVSAGLETLLGTSSRDRR